MSGTGLNGNVAIPKWVLSLVAIVVAALIGVMVQDRRQIGADIAELREAVARIRETRFREADGLKLEREIRDYVDARIRIYHDAGGDGP